MERLWRLAVFSPVEFERGGRPRAWRRLEYDKAESSAAPRDASSNGLLFEGCRRELDNLREGGRSGGAAVSMDVK
eukprot:5109914-Prymnesium_polylepis.1